MIVLVLNAGSSSLKYQLDDSSTGIVLGSGHVSGIGGPEALFVHRDATGETTRTTPHADHRASLALAMTVLTDPDRRIVRDTALIEAVGHRVVHGGSSLVAPALVTPDLLDALEASVPLAPLHNPPNITGIREAQRLLPDAVHVAVFDTAFHATIPEHAHRYPLPPELAAAHGIRKYGFHGTSCAAAVRRASSLLGTPADQLRLIVCHLGNGASVTAVRGGHSIDTSLGFGTSGGVMMGTRPGDVDASIIFHLARHAGMELAEIERLLFHRSGLLGVSGASNDMRVIEDRAAQGDPRCSLAMEMFAYRVRLYIGAYVAALGGLDALVFTGGIGENSATIRDLACRGLEVLGIRLDPAANLAAAATPRSIGAGETAAKVLVVPADEEAEIALQAEQVVRAFRAATAQPTVTSMEEAPA